jgi:DNA-binding beta-propeller fold protein YncE
MRQRTLFLRPQPSFLAAAAVAVLAVAGVAAANAGGPQSRQRGSVRLTGSPSIPAVNLRTHTLYVPIQCGHTNSCPGKPTGHLLDIIDTSKCNVQVVSRCRVAGQAAGGKGPLAAVLDAKTDTVYVIDSSGAVSVLDGRRCNATKRTHCGVLATIKTGGFDVAGGLNPRTHTLYVAAPSGDVFVIDVARCNARTTRGCKQRVRKVKDPRGPGSVGVDKATNTIYVADGGTDSPGDTVTVINGARCNGTTGTGCGTRPHTITVGSAPFWLTVDPSTDTVYVANNNDNTVSVIDGAGCNRSVSAGCHRHPPAVGTGGGVAFMAEDRSRHTLFVLNQTDGTMSEINTRTCNGHIHSGCPARAHNAWLPWKPPTGENPNAFALVPGTGTAYLVNGGGEAYLAPVSIKRCNALTTSGCRVEAPGAALNGIFPEVDPATDTIYAADSRKNRILVIDGAKCNAGDVHGCKPVATIPFPHPQANLGSIDRATDTLYAADAFANTVHAINIRHCNAHDSSGCSAPAPKMTIGPGPSIPVLDPATHTLYVPEGTNTSHGPLANRIAVLNAATCNVAVTSGCAQTPGAVRVGQNMFVIAVSPKTNTVYAMVQGSSGQSHQVWVVNGAACNATDHSGCASAVVAKAKVGLDPFFGIADDPAHTLYVANNAGGDSPGTVSIINTATCNGSNTSSCAATKPTVSVGRSPLGMALDARAHRLFVADFSHAAVSTIDTSRCNAAQPGGCGAPAREQAVGSQPFFVWVNSKKKTVYVITRSSGGGTFWSIFPTSR